jgi:hypothetical protein
VIAKSGVRCQRAHDSQPSQRYGQNQAVVDTRFAALTGGLPERRERPG